MNRKRVMFTYFVNADTFQDIMLSSTTAQLVSYSEKTIDQAKGFVRLGGRLSLIQKPYLTVVERKGCGWYQRWVAAVMDKRR
jgi:hypothetical protein